MPIPHAQKPLLLVFPFGLLSHYLRCIVLCRHLMNYFEIKFANHAEYSSFISGENFSLFECESIDAKFATQKMEKFDFSWINEPDLEKVFLQQVGAIEKFRPVAVLGDHSPTLKMAAEKTGVRFISLLNGYMSKHYSGKRSISRTHPAYSFVRLLPGNLADALTKKGESIQLRKIHKPFKSIRNRYDLDNKEQYQDEHEGDITLICDLPEIFPQKELPFGYQVIGPLVYGGTAPEHKISRVIDKLKKTIFITVGSTGDWRKLAFLNNPIFSKYNMVAAGDFHRILNASHIVHTDFLNVHELFPETDLVICHGGNGTMYQALLYRIPVLASTSHCEQEWNINAIEQKGMGFNLDRISRSWYQQTIEKWIEQKGNKTLATSSRMIGLFSAQLTKKIKEISEIIDRNNCTVEQVHDSECSEVSR